MQFQNQFFFILAIISSVQVFSQENNTSSSDDYSIATDRPSASFASSVVPKGILIAELGYFNQLTDFGNSIIISNQTMPNAMLRYGVNDRIELRLGTDFYQHSTKSDLGNSKVSGINPLNLGVKLHVQEEKGFIPQTTFLGQLQIAEIASKDFRLDRNQAFFRFMFQNNVSDKFFILYNVGMNFNNFDNQFVYTFLLGFVPIHNLTLFIESFGIRSSELSGIDNYAHVGAVYVINKRYQLDATFGYAYTQNELLKRYKK